MIFTGPVKWFCDDCVKKLSLPPSLDQSTPLSSVTRNYKNLEKNAIQTKRVFTNIEERVKKRHKLLKKKTKKEHKKGKVNSVFVDETKGVLSSSHDLQHPQNIISSQEEREVTNEREAAPRDVTSSDLGLQSVPFSEGATCNDSSCIELYGCVHAQPLIDPIWRYKSCFITFI